MMLKIDGKFRSDLVEGVSKYGPLRGIYAKLNGSQVEGIIVDYFATDVECGGLNFATMDCLSILKVEPIEENLDNVSSFMADAPEILDLPICLLSDIETFDI